ncbi:MAG: PD-(D/E)XK nuclease family protein [Polyangiaceae bacterium]|nr:PD-(D/E)XK nuclease family protein [Polyangiaceae bacterium]
MGLERKKLNVLTHSSVACFRRCPREYKYRYVMLRRVRAGDEAPALKFGTLMHAAMAEWWKHRIGGAAGCALDMGLRPLCGQGDPYERAKAQELLIAYDAYWDDSPLGTHLHVIGVRVEQEFAAPILSPLGKPSLRYVYAGKVDAVVTALVQPDRLTQLVVEHKTTSEDPSPETHYWEMAAVMDPQVTGYLDAYPGAEMLYDVIRKVDLRPGKATPEDRRKYRKDGGLIASQRAEDETPEEYQVRVREEIKGHPEKYFHRGRIVRLSRDSAQHRADLWLTCLLIDDALEVDGFVRHPHSCVRYSRLCEYFDVCSGQTSIDSDDRFRTADRPHEELSAEISEKGEGA